MFDLVIKQGRIVTAQADFIGDVGITDGIVIAISRDVPLPEGQETIDCSGKIVMPGFIDLHVHFNDPGVTYREDFLTGTSAAAAGGVTLIADMPLANDPVTVSAEAFEKKLRQAEKKAVIDYALWGGLVQDNTDELEQMHNLGACAFKAFTCFAGEDYPRSGDHILRKGLDEAKRLNSYVGVHCEDEELIVALKEAGDTDGKSELECFLASHSKEVEKTATKKTLAVAQATGGHVHICHASFPEIVELVEQFRSDGVVATVETCPQYLIFTEDHLSTIGGPLKCTPPVRDRESVEKLWQFLSEGRIDFLVTDHSPATENEKRGRAFSELWGGINGIQFLFQALFTEGVCKRGFSLQKLVELYSEAPARLSGLYPQRGDIGIGGDATFVVFDPDVEYVVTEKSMLTKNKQSPYMGMRFQGLVESTWIRGVKVYEHKNNSQGISVNQGFGTFVKFRHNR